jgi:hypothetical protein
LEILLLAFGMEPDKQELGPTDGPLMAASHMTRMTGDGRDWSQFWAYEAFAMVHVNSVQMIQAYNNLKHKNGWGSHEMLRQPGTPKCSHCLLN